MRTGMIKNRTLIYALAISIFLFNGHKIAGRFGSLPKEEIGDWAKEFPGLVITHQPFETVGTAAATISIYLLITGFTFLFGIKILSNPALKKLTSWYFAFIFAWGVHEIHHIFSLYPNGKTFALWFSISALVVLPAMLTWNMLLSLLSKTVFSNLKSTLFWVPGLDRTTRGSSYRDAPKIYDTINIHRERNVWKRMNTISKFPTLKNVPFCRLE